MGRPGTGLLAGACLLALTCAAPADPSETIALTFPPDLTPDVEALPRLPATSAAVKRINARLAALDRYMLDFALVCNSDPPRSFVGRDVDVVFLGPGLFSVLTLNESWCPGAAHGNNYALPYTFDLLTGDATSWPVRLPANLQDPARRPHRPDYIIGSKALTAVYLSLATAMDGECRDAILVDNRGYFRVWPSAEDRGLVLMPAGLAHAEQACADPVALPLARLRALDFPADLLEALGNPLALP